MYLVAGDRHEKRWFSQGNIWGIGRTRARPCDFGLKLKLIIILKVV
jgi:hypothetical protein